MNKFLMVLVTLMVTMFAGNALAYDPPAAPPNGGYVVDQSGKLSATQIQQLNRKIDAISKSTKNEFGVLLLPTMGGDNIEDVASSTSKKWGVGKRGLDNGCLIVVAIKERKSRIETGKGVEGEVTDIQASDILKGHLNPHLRSGDFYGGFDDTLNTLGSLMESRHNQKADPAPVATTTASAAPVADTSTTPKRTGGCDVSSAPAPSGSGTWVVILLLGVGGIAALLMARAAKRRREEEDRQREAAAKRRREKEEQIRQFQVRLAQERERREALAKATPPVTVPVMPSRTVVPPPVPVARVAVRPHAVPRPVSRAGETIESVVPTRPEPRSSHAAEALVAGAAALAAAEALHESTLRREREAREESDRRSREEERRARSERDEEERRLREEADRQSSSSYSSYSSSDSSSSSSSTPDYGSSSGSDSGGGFGGGDSGGGGSSSDW